MRPKARVLALISIMPNYNFAAIYSFGNIWPRWDSVVGYATGAGLLSLNLGSNTFLGARVQWGGGG